MELTLLRHSTSEESTLGCLLIGTRFVCYTLEDPPHSVKIPGDTRIPPGRYEIKLRTKGGLHSNYSIKFPHLHKGMLWLQNVPDFEWVYLHIGNTSQDTEGCILLGDQSNNNKIDSGRVSASTQAYVRVYPEIASAIEQGEQVWITIGDPVELLNWGYNREV